MQHALRVVTYYNFLAFVIIRCHVLWLAGNSATELLDKVDRVFVSSLRRQLFQVLLRILLAHLDICICLFIQPAFIEDS